MRSIITVSKVMTLLIVITFLIPVHLFAATPNNDFLALKLSTKMGSFDVTIGEFVKFGVKQGKWSAGKIADKWTYKILLTDDILTGL